MELNVQDWKEFKLSDYFNVVGTTTTKLDTLIDEYGIGNYPYVTTQATNNGVAGYYNCYTEEGNILVADSAVAGYVSYQPCNFSASDHVEKIMPKSPFNKYIAMFLVTILNLENYRYSYGRKFNQDNIRNTVMKLPAKQTSNGSYIPDWQFMEDYIKSLHHKPITTKVKSGIVKELDVDNWEEFYLKDLFLCQMGNGIDASATTNDNPIYNYVSRDSKGNGVVAQVDEYNNVSKSGKTSIEEPFQAGTMTLALGGSFLGSCFVQKYPYYTAQNVAVLTEKEPLSIATKLFISTLIRNECKYKYLAFGRELNTHYKTDFMIKLPIKRNSNGNPVTDDNRTYSDNGYIPDWQFMEDYINSLPYSDRI